MMLKIWFLFAAFIIPFTKSNSADLRIVHGQIAKPHQFPYLVKLKMDKKNRHSSCSGSLITNNYVLTAAHCLDSAESVTVIFGVHNRSDDKEPSRLSLTSYKNTSGFFNHKEYDRENHHINDIALIKLSEPVKESQYIRIIPLAKGDKTYENSDAIESGWGKISTTPIKQDADVLRFTVKKILTNKECLKATHNRPETCICVTGDGACYGDSGSPLVVDGVQVGISSNHHYVGEHVCEDPRSPNVFTRVSAYYDWITEHSDLK